MSTSQIYEIVIQKSSHLAEMASTIYSNQITALLALHHSFWFIKQQRNWLVHTIQIP
jgi:hypothetical protein